MNLLMLFGIVVVFLFSGEKMLLFIGVGIVMAGSFLSFTVYI